MDKFKVPLNLVLFLQYEKSGAVKHFIFLDALVFPLTVHIEHATGFALTSTLKFQ
jgi:hypothetical protein